VQEQLARDAVHAAVQLEVRLEGSDEVGVTLVVSERTENALGVGLDVTLRLTEDEAVRTKVLEVRRLRFAAVRADQGDGLFRLEEREVRAGGPALRARNGDRQLVIVRVLRDATAQPLPLAARVDVFIHFEDRSDHIGARPYDLRVGRRGRGHRRPQVPVGDPARERDRQISRVTHLFPP